MKRVFIVFSGIVLLAAILLTVGVVTLPLPGTIPVLMYHFLGTKEDAESSKNFVSLRSFNRHMQWLRWLGYRVISLDEYYKIITGIAEPEGREIVTTFDDGNYTFKTVAMPILEKYNYPVAVFVVSESVKEKLHGSMSTEEVTELSRDEQVTVASHSKTHPFLSKMDKEQIRDELKGAREDLEKMLKRSVHYLAYPYGDFNEDVIRVAEKAGYRLAFTTSRKKLKGKEETLFSLTRVKITRTADNPLIFWVKISGLYDFFKQLRGNMKGNQLS